MHINILKRAKDRVIVPDTQGVGGSNPPITTKNLGLWCSWFNIPLLQSVDHRFESD